MSAPEFRITWLSDADPSAAADGCAGKAAFSADGRRVGRVSDVISDAETGEALVYVLETAPNRTRYLPAFMLARETAHAIRLAPSAGSWLGSRGAHPAEAISYATAEFVIWDDFPPQA